MISADYTRETGMHAYRRYDYPEAAVFRSDNRSAYDGLSLRVQGNVSHRVNLTAHYTLSSAKTWGCVLGELFDYVNGVCNPYHAFAPGDYGPPAKMCATVLCLSAGSVCRRDSKFPHSARRKVPGPSR